MCVNYKGDFKCECHEGYEIDPVTKTCKAEGEWAPIRRECRERRVDSLVSVPHLKHTVCILALGRKKETCVKYL